MLTDCAAEDRMTRLERIQQRPDRRLARHFDDNLSTHACQRPQMLRQLDPNPAHLAHRIVCTSTESTAGRSRTMGFQLSPESADAYTCPPVVPK